LNAKSCDILEDIKDEIRKARESSDRKAVIKWLSRSVPDPSKEHNIAREKFQPTTGSWLLEADELEAWMNSKNSLLWLTGGGGYCVPFKS
jgi:hypothetical protein